MATLVARLAAPIQAWGSVTRYRSVNTHDTPTWSGLIGLCRAALGHGRAADLADIRWLLDLTMAVRVDRPGQQRTDYQTINPLPKSYLRFRGMTPKGLGVVPLGEAVEPGKGATRWMPGGQPGTMITPRDYLHDAAFTWLITGPDKDLDQLHNALLNPTWQLGLGRKSCPPSSPLVLGMHQGALDQVAGEVPSLTTGHRGKMVHLTLVTLHGASPVNAQPGAIVQDRPIGAHPQQGYTTNQHQQSTVEAPTVADWTDLLTYAQQHLTQPLRTHEESA
jgi:CRISPR system Cascade subunit CasD